MTPRIHALIPAAGQSVRFGGMTYKQYAHLLGKAVIAHSIDAVRQHPAVHAVTVALASDDGIYDELIRPDYPDVRTVIGGDSRAQTVLNGLQDIRNADADCRWVLVHDAARPCLSAALLEALVSDGLGTEDGAILAVPVGDTLKVGNAQNRIERTLDRCGLWAAQTPQLFPLLPLLKNLSAAMKFGTPPTDEAEAMERAGRHPLLVSGSAANVKITRPDDLALAESVLRTRGKGGES